MDEHEEGTDPIADRLRPFEAELVELDDAIALHPEAPANYVMRGEIYLRARLDDLACQDFERAIVLAADEIETRAWGLIAQAMQDRARRGLKIARRRLASRNS
jgi:Tfp pilus assembly protein PilF